ncbi:N-acetyltransferase [Aneurinibacillus terranovensis]|uniref:N-acetyltransferase n=1 Tax=Aneurinibacillus terranovensis TaxID=278991 RepID=UPI0004011293|nr:N-acetyltransferase [Aneurinibacillus terranovensis]
MNIFREFERIFEEHAIPYTFESKGEDHYIYRTNEEMRDAGITPDNVMLDFNLDQKNEALFLGMIRIPHSYRNQSVGAKLVLVMKEFAKENHWVIILESAPENLLFWQKMHFSTFLYESYGFWMMGYGAKNKLAFKVKWQQMKKYLYAEAH